MAVFNLQTPWIRQLISISFILIVALIAHFLAVMTWKFVVTPNYNYSSAIELPKQVAQSTSSVSDSTKASRIANVHVFGQFKEKQAEQVEVEKPVAQKKVTPLKFVLMATMVSGSAKNSMASIADGRDVGLFSVGEDVFEKATLYAVYDDRVEFERDNGDIEILEYKEDKQSNFEDYIAPERGANLGNEFEYKETPSSKKSYSREVTKDNSTLKSTIRSSSNRNELPDIVSNVSNQAAKVDKVQESINKDSKVKSQVQRYVNNQISKAKSNPVSTLTQYGLKFIPGKGYEVTSRARDLKLLGLRDKDIIISINGNTATSPEEDIKLIDQVMASGEILIEYERNGKVLVMKQALLQF